MCLSKIKFSAARKLITGLIFASLSELLLAADTSAVQEIASDNLTPQQSLLPMIGGLLSVLAIIFVLAILLKKITALKLVSKHINVIESQHLGAKEKLVIVEIQNKQYVLGVTAHTINTICELSKVIDKPQKNIGFDQLLKQLVDFPKHFSNNADKVNKPKAESNTKPSASLQGDR